MNWTERLDELTKPQRQLVLILDQQVQARRQLIRRDRFKKNATVQSFVYLGMHDFLLQHGVWYEPTTWRMEWEQGVPKMCFGNALVLGFVDRLRYVEGVSLSPDLPMEVHHAWNTDDTGALIDNTWLNTGSAYLGVEFSIGRADYASWFDDGSVLQNPKDRFRLFREPWRGEDFAREWKKSPGRIQAEMVRDGEIMTLRWTMRTGVSREVKA